MAISTQDDGVLLTKPSEQQDFSAPNRTTASYIPHQHYHLPRGQDKHYQQQYADLYFARLARLKPHVEAVAAEAFGDFAIASENARRVDRVLDVRQGELVWVIGTIFMDMALKPNVLEDLGKEHWIAAPPPREKYIDPSGAGLQMMLEDESGRLRLTGGFLQSCLLVTGAIVAVLGTENKDGDFDVLDLRLPDLPPQPERTAPSGNTASKLKKSQESTSGVQRSAGKAALVSGLSMTGDEGDTLTMDLLMEWLLGEAASPEQQDDAAQISRLIIAGNSLAHSAPIPSREDVAAAKKAGRKTYGYDSSAYNAAPTTRLDTWLSMLLPSLPVTLLPGVTDPTSTALPQQPIHPAMFPHSRSYGNAPSDATTIPWFDSTTNPADFTLNGWRFLGTGGQPVDDINKYVTAESRVELMEAMLRWRLTAPTAPDTLWCYPFQDGDRFVLTQCPHVYFVGNQPRFETAIIEGPAGQKVRLVAIPSYKETGEVVVLDLETLDAEVVKIELYEDGTG